MARKIIVIVFCGTLFAATICGFSVLRNQRDVSSRSISFRDVTASTGISFIHTDGSSGRRYIVEPMSAGLATFDYDRDGRIDIYFLNGAALPGTQYDTPPRNALYRNLGNFHFQDISHGSGLDDPGFGLGVAIADYDNDGFSDVYLNNHGPNVLCLNNGDGTFTPVTARAGVSNGELVGAGACFVDIDTDGDLDLYAGNYLKLDYESHVEKTINGLPTYPSPRDFFSVADTLFRNEGDGSFTNISDSSGIAAKAARAMGTICSDADADGDADIFVVNDVDPNFYWVNDGTGHFEESGLKNGTAYNQFGDENAGMGVDCADYDHDGLLDFFMTTYRGQMPVLYRNLSKGQFQDVTTLCGAGDGTFERVKWGTGLVDFDNDSHCDIFIVNGHTEDNIEMRDSGACYRCPNTVLRNGGDGRFKNVTADAGEGLRGIHCGRGAAFDDLDNDGDIDVVILNSREAPTILRNDLSLKHNWIQIELRGTFSNREAVGANVRLTAGKLALLDEVHSGRGYQGHYGSRLHFGLGSSEVVDRIVIQWPGGGSRVLTNIAVNQRLMVSENGTVFSMNPLIESHPFTAEPLRKKRRMRPFD